MEPIQDHPALLALRYPGDFALKAGILPYRREGNGALRFLVAAPRPVKNLEDTVPFAIARGSRRMRIPGAEWADVRTEEAARQAREQGAELESAHLTAVKEGEEELGLPPNAIRALYDCGILAYKDYGIHLFLAEMEEGSALLPARDSAATRWFGLEEAQEMVRDGRFNPGYLPLLEAMAVVASSL